MPEYNGLIHKFNEDMEILKCKDDVVPKANSLFVDKHGDTFYILTAYKHRDKHYVTAVVIPVEPETYEVDDGREGEVYEAAEMYDQIME